MFYRSSIHFECQPALNGDRCMRMVSDLVRSASTVVSGLATIPARPIHIAETSHEGFPEHPMRSF